MRYVPAWFPGMGLKRHALRTRKVVDEVIEKPFQEAKSRKVGCQLCIQLVGELMLTRDCRRIDILHGFGPA